MQQTLLSLLALLIATFLSFNQMQADIQSQKQTVQAELAQMGLGVAMQTMEVVRARAFDAATIGIPEEEYLDPEADGFALKSEGEFGGTGDCLLHPEGSGVDCNTVEEFHGTSGEVPFTLAGNTFPFTVEIEVHYVCSNLERASDSAQCSPPTSRKEVVMNVQDSQPDGEAHYLHEPLVYSEVIAYP